MSILDRSALEESPLADLHAIASELSIDGYRRLRKPELINAILERQGGGAEDGGGSEEGADSDTDAPDSATDAADEEPADSAELAGVVAEEIHARDTGATAARRRRGRRGGRSRGGREESGRSGGGREDDERSQEDEDETQVEETRGEAREEEARGSAEEVAEGVVELLPNGSGFMRVEPPEPSEDDVYISAAQVKRCELVPGDHISGPRRAPRRSERFASLVRVDTINGRPASEVADSARFDDLPAGYPEERFRFGSEDPTIKAIEFLTPFGRGSRVVISGGAQAGKTEALHRLALSLAGQDGLTVLLVLAGVRPEEVSDWSALEPTATVTMAGSSDAQAQAVDRIVDQGRRIAARGGHAVVLVDTLDGLSPSAARKALAAARRTVATAGSLTVVATTSKPLGGETTVISLDARLTAAGRYPAVDLATSWTMHAEKLVGDAGAEAITRTRAEALGD